MVYDEKFESAKRCKMKGLGALEVAEIHEVDYAVDEWDEVSSGEDQPTS